MNTQNTSEKAWGGNCDETEIGGGSVEKPHCRFLAHYRCHYCCRFVIHHHQINQLLRYGQRRRKHQEGQWRRKKRCEKRKHQRQRHRRHNW